MLRSCLAVFLTFSSLVFLSLAPSSLAMAETLKPAVVYSVGGKFDQSFNEAAYRGLETFKEETGTAYREFEILNDAQSLQAVRSFARKDFSPVIAVGFNHAAAVTAAASEFPDTRFILIDAFVDAPNVQSVLFREHEGAYLVGILAQMASKTGKIGYVGGMDIPLIRKFECGYRQGSYAANPNGTVFANVAGTTVAAWTDPAKGAELARSQMDRGADVILHGAGTTGLGVLQAAADAGKFGIGVDSNQNGLHPGFVLTSMLKRVDVAVFDALTALNKGDWQPGARVLGLAEGGIGWALDDNNRSLITEQMQVAVEKAERDIVSGIIKVHDSTRDGACPL
ncbi:BMP family lipoprotein [Coralliovum pocilloporae]|uniref:BMP family lipoprotein n=1 Tax=Coralliovum pocilloporae TaxID=3066369 RepID=UPI003307BCD0